MISLALVMALAMPADSGLSIPLPCMTVTSPYGYRTHPLTGRWLFHAGVDLRAHRDTVYSALPGTIGQVGHDAGLGRYIRINHGQLTTVYGHLSVIGVHPGQSVHAGQPIAITGTTGAVTGEHLHFEVHLNGTPINPQRLFTLIGMEIGK